MIGEPQIIVDCDKCGCEECFGMTCLASGAWDDRNLKRAMARIGWVISGDNTYCSPECAEEAKAEAMP